MTFGTYASMLERLPWSHVQRHKADTMNRHEYAAHAALRDTARSPSAPRPAAPSANPKPATLADALRWLAAASAVLLVVGLFV